MPRKSSKSSSINSPARRSSWPPGKRRLQELAAEALTDTYNESEQRAGFFTMIEEHLKLPFETEILGVTVSVQRVDLTLGDEIVAICRRGGKHRTIPILDLPLPDPPPAGAEWIEAYRYWTRGM
jgi:hypothetical protein